MERIDSRSEGTQNVVDESPAHSSVMRGRQTLTRPRRDSWDSRKLLDGRAEVSIKHNGEIYTLHHTQAGKLLLTK
ncbi:hypothetical protein BH10PSE17_BH10PSE17_36570 [soil metagenome]